MTRRRVLSWLLAAVLLGAAVFVRTHDLDTEAAHAPIDVHGAVGARLTGRNVTAVVNAVYVTPRIEVLRRNWDEPDVYRPTGGAVYAVFDIVASATVARNQTTAAADLVIGADTFGEIYAGLPPNAAGLDPGIPSRAGVAFEIPATLDRAPAQFRFIAEQDSRLDSRLVFDVDLAAAQHVPVLHYGDDGLHA